VVSEAALHNKEIRGPRHATHDSAEVVLTEVRVEAVPYPPLDIFTYPRPPHRQAHPLTQATILGHLAACRTQRSVWDRAAW
jgi:hypothetical protein